MSDDTRSWEATIHPKMVSMWADRCYDIKKKSGQAAANEFFRRMFSRELQELINTEIRSRNKKKNGKG